MQYAKANDVSLFILDIQLEDYKGTSLAKQLRELPEYKYTPIILKRHWQEKNFQLIEM